MHFYFAWAEADEAFDPDIHLKEDEKVVALKINHNEGEIPYAQIHLCHDTEKAEEKGEKAFISCVIEGTPTLLFSGFLMSVPDNILSQTVRLEFIAEPSNAIEILKENEERLKELPCCDYLFSKKDDQDQTEEVLDGYSVLPHWSRTMDDFCFSDIFEGHKVKEVENNFVHDSLKMRLRTPPIDKITCAVTAEWEQTYQGVVDAGFGIKSLLKGGIIATLTPNTLLKNWWTPDAVIPGGTYNILSSCLHRGAITGDSAAFEVYGDATPQTLPVYALEPELTISYALKQKRRETVHFEIKNNCQQIFKFRRFGNNKHLTFKLEDITYDNEKNYWEAEKDYKKGETIYYQNNYYTCNKDHKSNVFFSPFNWDISFNSKSALGDLSSASYFLTERGRQSIESAIERCKAHLAESTRSVEINIRLPFYEGLDLDCDTTLYLKDPRLPNGRACGKVVAYSMVVFDAAPPYVDVKLLCSAGNKKTEDAEIDHKTPSGIGYRDYSECQPESGILDPSSLSGTDVVLDVGVKNDADQQNEYLGEQKFLSKQSARKMLSVNPTSVDIRLLDINNPEILSHTIRVDVPNGWTAPCQIEF